MRFDRAMAFRCGAAAPHPPLP